MKKVLFFVAFLLFAGISVSAQNSSKSCSHDKSASADVSEMSGKAVAAADQDESIEVRTCEKSGNVSFYKKDVCEKSGKVSYTEVEYQEANGEFAVMVKNDEVNSSPKAKAKDCKPSPLKGSCSSTGKKSCCSSKSGKKSCSSKS